MKLNYEVNKNGTKLYTNAKDELHRTDGPAIEYANGTKYWYRNGQYHREDGPAIEYANGTKYWYRNGQYHRTDGPAAEWADGTKEWYRNGKRHREDGPASEYADGERYWYRNGQYLTEAQFNKRTKPVVKAVKAKLQTIEIEGLVYKLIKA